MVFKQGKLNLRLHREKHDSTSLQTRWELYRHCHRGIQLALPRQGSFWELPLQSRPRFVGSADYRPSAQTPSVRTKSTKTSKMTKHEMANHQTLKAPKTISEFQQRKRRSAKTLRLNSRQLACLCFEYWDSPPFLTIITI